VIPLSAPRTAARPRLVLAVALLATFGLTACGSGSDGESGDAVVLNIQHSGVPSEPFSGPLKAAFKQFEKENPNIDIQEKVVDVEDSPQVYETSLTAGEPAEIVMINLYGKPTRWMENQATLPVTDYLEEWGLAENLIPEAVSQWEGASGDVQAFPYFGFAWPVFYNTAMLKDAGVDAIPQTSEDLLAASQKLKASGKGGLAIGGRDWSGNKFFWQVIQAYVTEDEMKDLYVNGGWADNPNVRKGVDLFTELRDAGVFIDSAEGQTVDAMYAAYNEQKAAVMSAGSWAFEGTPDAVVGGTELAGLPMPEDSVHEKPTVYAGYTSLGFWLSPTAEEKIDAVEKFMKFMYEPETFAPFIEEGGYLPPFADADFDVNKVHPLLREVLEGKYEEKVELAVLPDTFVPPDTLSETERATSLAYSPGTSTDEIIDALEAAYK
jgi:multiple sugar transport system substrate-binding protein